MKKNNLIGSAIIAVALTLSVIGGCKKDNDDSSVNPSTETMYDNAIAEASFDDAGNVADEGVTGNLSSYRVSEGEGLQTTCARVIIDLFASPHIMSIDFGATDCLCKDGNYRRGKIMVSWVGNYKDSASSHSITFDNYYLNFNQITGTKTVTNTGRNANGHLTFSVTVNGTVIVNPQYSQTGASGTITYSSTRSREWSEGESTPLNWLDDVYLITGSAHGTTVEGISYTAAIDGNNPLRKEIGFPHFTKGIVSISPSNQSVRMIDYGYLNGERDNLARVTIDGNMYIIRLGRRG